MSGRPRLLGLARDRRGATLAEFGIILVPLLISVTGLLDLAYSAYMKAMIQGALQTAAREASLGVKTPAEIEADVKATVGEIVADDDIDTDIRSYSQFSRRGKPEKLTHDENGNGRYDAGDCYVDENDNAQYDEATSTGRASTGQPDDVIAYTVTVDHARILPVAALFGMSATEKLVATTMVRNQPFAKPQPIRTLCPRT